jgi:hypothetical protein
MERILLETSCGAQIGRDADVSTVGARGLNSGQVILSREGRRQVRDTASGLRLLRNRKGGAVPLWSVPHNIPHLPASAIGHVALISGVGARVSADRVH